MQVKLLLNEIIRKKKCASLRVTVHHLNPAQEGGSESIKLNADSKSNNNCRLIFDCLYN